jgi:hypothetical protein
MQAYKTIRFIRHWQPSLECFRPGETHTLPANTADQALTERVAVNVDHFVEIREMVNIPPHISPAEKAFTDWNGINRIARQVAQHLAFACVLIAVGITTLEYRDEISSAMDYIRAPHTFQAAQEEDMEPFNVPNSTATLYRGLHDMHQYKLATIAPQLAEGK